MDIPYLLSNVIVFLLPDNNYMPALYVQPDNISLPKNMSCQMDKNQF